MRFASYVLIALAIPAAARACANVKIESDEPANVYLDGKLVGAAPLSLSKLKHGTREVKVENLQTSEVKMFHVVSPKEAVIGKEIDVKWNEAVSHTRVVHEEEEEAQPVHRTVYVERPRRVHAEPLEAGPPVPVVDPEIAREDRHASRQERQKVRSRNVLLGTAAANEIFNKGSSKSTVRGVSLGGALLNEVLRTGR